MALADGAAILNNPGSLFIDGNWIPAASLSM